MTRQEYDNLRIGQIVKHHHGDFFRLSRKFTGIWYGFSLDRSLYKGIEYTLTLSDKSIDGWDLFSSPEFEIRLKTGMKFSLATESDIFHFLVNENVVRYDRNDVRQDYQWQSGIMIGIFLKTY